MSNGLIDKSLLYLEAANDLKKHCHYDAVCHPAYYSCLQLMMVKAMKILNKTKWQLGSMMSVQGGKSHKFIIDTIKTQLKYQYSHSLIDFSDYRSFNSVIDDLKIQRRLADYTENRITPEVADKCITEATLARQIINKL